MLLAKPLKTSKWKCCKQEAQLY